MSFDNSRFTFDPWNDYCGVVMEQGRVQLDSDWNEWLAQLQRRIQAGTLDTVGRAVYPATTPNAFKITASSDSSGNHLTIGAGRMYVDGLLAENHGPSARAQWDPALAEASGAPQPPGGAAVAVDFTKQPYLPGAALPKGNGPFLAYLDVWRRPVTYLQDSELVDKAVGVDATGRLQTVWQVKLLDAGSVKGASCDSVTSLADWQALLAPPAGRLTNGVASLSQSGPCCLASNTGYTGMENQFYRVEIHRGGGPSGKQVATFKWSRDNASVITGVSGISTVTNSAGNSASQLTVDSLGRDQVLGFAPGQWIEITDDVQELNGEAGELHLIDSIDAASRTITLDATVSAADFPVTSGKTDPRRHTRLTRWDQSGKVYKDDGVTVWTDLGAAGSSGDIPVPPAGTKLILENNITVAFDLNPSTGSFRVGDFWTFSARTADGSIDPLSRAYPRGIHHHYAQLAVVTFPSSAPDCRIEWPPAAGDGSTCGCTRTVSPSDFTARQTLQDLLDQYRGLQTPTTICLMPGTYNLGAPLRFSSAHSNISLRACQEGAVRFQAVAGQEDHFNDGMIVLDNANNVGISGIYFAIPLSPFKPAAGKFAGLPVNSLDPDVQSAVNNLVASIGVRTVNCTGLTIENCEFGFHDMEEDVPPSATPFGVGIFAGGQCSSWRIAGNTFAGIGNFLAGVLLAPSAVFNLPIVTVPPVTHGAPAPAKGIEVAPREFTVAEPFLNIGIIGVHAAQTGPAPGAASRGGSVLPSFLSESTFTDNRFSGLTVGALLLGGSGTIQFTDNEVDECQAGFWMVSPLQASTLLYDPKNVALVGLLVAMGYPLPAQDTSKPVTVAAAPASVLAYTGAAAYTDSLGHVWTPDDGTKGLAVQGGAVNRPTPAPAITNAQPSANDQALYQSERWGTFTYTYPSLPPGYYTITLKFAEIVHTNATNNKGVRIFNVAINGQTVLHDFDIVADANGADIADDQVFQNVVPDGSGRIVVQFTGTNLGTDANAKISAAALDPQWNGIFSGAPLLQQNPAFVHGSTELLQFYVQLAQLSQQGFAPSATPIADLRVTANEMQGLSAPGVLILGDDQVQHPKISSLMLNDNRMQAAVGLPAKSAFGGINAIYFVSVAAVSLVTRCVVSGNMVVNDAQSSALTDRQIRFSFVLNDAPDPAPGILVAGNLFQGRLVIQPDRFPANTNVPAPMNSWNFLNTVLP